MIRINLLPFRTARKKENVRRQLSILLSSLLLAIILMFYINIRLSSQVKEVNSKVESTKTEIAKYEKINKEIAEIKGKLEVLKTKMNVINDLEANRYEPVRLMDVMTTLVIPNRMWFLSFDAIGKTVNISGVAVDSQTVADFMIRLEGSNLFESVNLKTIKKQMVRQASLKNFEISCNKKSAKQVVKSEAKK
ncbi:MAG: PilN domain-containing protein [Proteobacteria bacterium]|nr:PilN domain-containing protein [Pseudomonadota bacterium]